MKKLKLKPRKLFLLLCVTAALALAASEATFAIAARGRTRGSVDTLPRNKAALVLGAIEILPNGRRNMYFDRRIDAATRLYESGKVEFLVVSGDNSRRDYNEPEAMKNALVRRGVPAERIYLDYAGFRTLDSVVRMREIFGQAKFTVVSQKFHNERAVFIARCKGIDAVGYNADDVSGRAGFKTNLRERLARLKAIADIITGKQPKFLGGKIELK